MEPQLYLNIHSHSDQETPGVWTLQNRYEDFARITERPGRAYSLGIHPWYIGDLAGQWAALAQHAVRPEVLAVGECGLDKVCATPWALQEAAFKAQIALADQLKKPLIIHCVRAYTEAAAMLRASKVPVLFHGFQKKPALARQLTDQGFYLSFGRAIVDKRPQAVASLAQVPAEHFFLETDDDPALDIRTVYRAAAAIRKTGEDALILQLQKNYTSFFGRRHLPGETPWDLLRPEPK